MFIVYNAQSNNLAIESNKPNFLPHVYAINMDIINKTVLGKFSIQIKHDGFSKPLPTIVVSNDYAAHQSEVDNYFTAIQSKRPKDNVNEFDLNFNNYHVKTIKSPHVGLGYYVWIDLCNTPL